MMKSAGGMQGIITQMTDVKPLITVATYLDDESGFEIYQEVPGASTSWHRCYDKGFSDSSHDDLGCSAKIIYVYHQQVDNI